ncbi:MAG: hypothetical protein HY913_07550 [Desulfomonile tiedjei]|nr:hypothetical protein [Desulfomonile tiedjei]
MTETTSSKPYFWPFFLLLIFEAMAFGMVICRPLKMAVMFTVIDDAMYYPKIAYNIINHGIVSYDGVTITNGFHPLYLFFLLPIYSFFTDPMIALKAVYVLAVMILTAAMILFLIISRKLHFSTSGLFVSLFILLLNIRSFTIFFSLLECHLVLLAYLTYVLFSLSTEEKRFTSGKLACFNGLIIGIAFLARLDSFLLALAYGAILVTRTWQGKQSRASFVKAGVCAASGTLILALPYLAVNYFYFGHLSSVSAWQKIQKVSSFHTVLYEQYIPRVKYVLGLQALPSWFFVAAALLALLIIIIYLFSGDRLTRMRRTLPPIADFMAFACLHTVFICLFAQDDAAASAWYWVPELVAISLIAGVTIPDTKIYKVKALPLVIIILLIGQAFFYPHFVKRKTMTKAKLEVAEYINKNLPANVMYAMYDSGIVSYFSQRNFIALNGLIGDFKLAAMIKQGDYRDVIDEYSVRFIVLDVPEPMLQSMPGEKLFSTETKTKFTDFKETEKPFVVFKITPDEFQQLWDIRYHKSRKID